MAPLIGDKDIYRYIGKVISNKCLNFVVCPLNCNTQSLRIFEVQLDPFGIHANVPQQHSTFSNQGKLLIHIDFLTL